MRKKNKLIILTVLVLMAAGCIKSPFEREDSLYKRPNWLAGKLFTQLKAKPELSTFTRCVELAGYDTLINTSGSFTIFAPNNEAFDLFFQEHPEYNNSVENIPLAEIRRIVKYHLLQNAWSYEQLTQLDIYGWIDTTDENNDEANGYKRETILRDPNPKFGVANSGNPRKTGDELQLAIVDTLSSPWYRRQFTDTRKYVPIFYAEYLYLNDLTPADYAFYFNRSFDPANIYYAGAQIINENTFAENGFIHVIDRVVEPLKNAIQILKDQSGSYSYKKFMDMANKFPKFSYNKTETEKQPGVAQGIKVDSLFDITYPDLAFNLTNEKTRAPKSSSGLPNEVTIRYHHGMVAPTDQAVTDFENDYLVGSGKWGSFAEAPVHIRRMFVNTHMSENSIYPSDFAKGYVSGENDDITLDESTIIQKEYGSNCTFIGVNKALVPRAFKSITGPIYLQRNYKAMMYAIEKTGLLSQLKRNGQNYTFFVEDEPHLRIDSSLFYDEGKENFYLYQLIKGAPSTKIMLGLSDVRNLIMNHLGTERIQGLARKEFIPNLAGNYIIVNNETGEVSGNTRTTFGYQGTVEDKDYPVQISDNSDNGVTYQVNNWLCFSSSELYSLIAVKAPAFQQLLVNAGLFNSKEYSYTFVSTTDRYTVFIPTDAALAAYNTSSMTKEELKKFCLLFVVPGTMIFTDGRQPARYYETARPDEASTQFSTVYTKLYIDPEVNTINFRKSDGTNYLTVQEADGMTNYMAARVKNNTEQSPYPTLSTYAVVHIIDKVFVKNQMDTE